MYTKNGGHCDERLFNNHHSEVLTFSGARSPGSNHMHFPLIDKERLAFRRHMLFALLASRQKSPAAASCSRRGSFFCSAPLAEIHVKRRADNIREIQFHHRSNRCFPFFFHLTDPPYVHLPPAQSIFSRCRHSVMYSRAVPCKPDLYRRQTGSRHRCRSCTAPSG